MGAFAVLIFPAVFINGIVEKNIFKKPYCWISILALLFCLVETQSRGPFLGFMVSLCLFLFIPVKGFHIFKKIAVLCIFLIVFFLFMPGFFEHSTERFTTIDEEMDSGKRSRLSVWTYALRIISDNPFLGIGLGEQQFLKRMFQYGFATEFQQRPLDNPHNSFLQIAVYAGIPALIIFVAINVSLLKRGISIVKNNINQDMSYYLMGVISGLIGFLACSFTGGFIFYTSVSPVYWLFLGLLFAMTNSEKSQEST
jgi:putative inorganic carbon (HCO3(-)) transporter